jgi:hypothetical protein
MRVTATNVSEEIAKNVKKLYRYAQITLSMITKSLMLVPRELRFLFNKIRKTTEKRFVGHADLHKIKHTCITGFLFLRLFCPAVLNPKLFQVTSEYPDAKTSRTLTLLAKCLQCLGNLASFGMKEDYMLEMNAFIMENSMELMDFIDSLCTLSSNPTPFPCRLVDGEKHYGLLHRFVRNHLRELQKIKIKSAPRTANNAPIPFRRSTSLDILSSEDIAPVPQQTDHIRMKYKQLEELIQASEEVEKLINSKLE